MRIAAYGCVGFYAHAQLLTRVKQNCVVESESFRAREWNYGKWGYQKYKACGLELDLELPKETHCWWQESTRTYIYTQFICDDEEIQLEIAFRFLFTIDKFLSLGPPLWLIIIMPLCTHHFTSTMMMIKRSFPSHSCVCESTSWKKLIFIVDAWGLSLQLFNKKKTIGQELSLLMPYHD